MTAQAHPSNADSRPRSTRVPDAAAHRRATPGPRGGASARYAAGVVRLAVRELDSDRIARLPLAAIAAGFRNDD